MGAMQCCRDTHAFAKEVFQLHVHFCRVAVAWWVLFVWLLFGAGTLRDLEYTSEIAREQEYCAAKASLLSNLTLGDRGLLTELDSVLDVPKVCTPPKCAFVTNYKDQSRITPAPTPALAAIGSYGSFSSTDEGSVEAAQLT